MAAIIHQFPCHSDNFGVLLHDPATGATASIDTPEAVKVRQALRERGWKLTHILITHHHADHIDGLAELAAETGAEVVANGADAHRIPAVTRKVAPGDMVEVGQLKAKVIDTPGHTVGHIAYWFADAKLAFVGDTLFSGGCGRMFEGNPQGFWGAMLALRALPDETMIYCGHEYTASNIRFALAVDPDNVALQARARQVETLLQAGHPTIPTRLGDEKLFNPFLRADDAALKARLGMADAADAAVFGELRERKNRF